VTGRDGDAVVVDVHGTALKVPSRDLPTHGTVRIGVRPEKLDIVPAADADADGRNALDGTVVDSSFIGVSVQYVVRTGWDDELMVPDRRRAVVRADDNDPRAGRHLPAPCRRGGGPVTAVAASGRSVAGTSHPPILQPPADGPGGYLHPVHEHRGGC
jgi:hypothetical protein